MKDGASSCSPPQRVTATTFCTAINITNSIDTCSHQSWKVTYGAFWIAAGREDVNAAKVSTTVSVMPRRLERSGADESQNDVAANHTSRFMVITSQQWFDNSGRLTTIFTSYMSVRVSSLGQPPDTPHISNSSIARSAARVMWWPLPRSLASASQYSSSLVILPSSIRCTRSRCEVPSRVLPNVTFRHRTALSLMGSTSTSKGKQRRFATDNVRHPRNLMVLRNQGPLMAASESQTPGGVTGKELDSTGELQYRRGTVSAPSSQAASPLPLSMLKTGLKNLVQSKSFNSSAVKVARLGSLQSRWHVKSVSNVINAVSTHPM
mmetsp:Transcript_27021/g.62421  ORF Transcript_27021/g.62421 Transcript_27021/m.62421 type:complete len:321 (+) Transcript_27021:988-1950(+)